jgi:hypothetical protein
MLDTLTESNVVAVGENDMKRTGCVKSYLRSICTVKGVLSGNLLNHILLMYQSSCSCANATFIGLRILKLNFELCTYSSKQNFDIALHFFHQFDNFRCSNIVIGMNLGRSGEPDIAVKKLSLAARTQKKAPK